MDYCEVFGIFTIGFNIIAKQNCSTIINFNQLTFASKNLYSDRTI